MNVTTWDAVKERFKRFRSFWGQSVQPDEFDAAFSALGSPSVDYREFVLRYGGGYVGTYPIYGLRMAESMGKIAGARTAPELTDVFRSRKWPGIEDWLVFSVDQSGNPIGLRPDGAVWISDLEHNQVTSLAESFEAFLRKWALRLDPF
jgi:hypothetical protein